MKHAQIASQKLNLGKFRCNCPARIAETLDTNEAFAYNKHLPSLVAQSAERAAVNR